MKKQKTIQKAKQKGQTINLYTLNNDSSISNEFQGNYVQQLQNFSDSQSSQSQNETSIDFIKRQKQQQKKISRLSEENYALQLKLRQTIQQNELFKVNMQSHQTRQKQIVKKMAKLQVINQKLETQMKQFIKFQKQRDQQVKNEAQQKKQLKTILKKINQQKTNFISYFQKIILTLQKSKVQYFQTQKEKILQYLKKMIKENFNENKKQIDLSYNYQFDRINFMNEEKSILQQQINDLKQALHKTKQEKNQIERQVNQLKNNLQKEKYEKKKIMINYSEQIDKLKQKINLLTKNIEDQQERNQNRIKNIIQDKNLTIEKLKEKIKESRKREQSFYEKDKQKFSISFLQSKKNRKKSFIGDGSQQDDYLQQIKLSTINREIQKLQKQLLIQFQS